MVVTLVPHGTDGPKMSLTLDNLRITTILTTNLRELSGTTIMPLALQP
jgi:hypothetical protein